MKDTLFCAALSTVMVVVSTAPQYRAVVDPSAHIISSSIPPGVTGVLIRFCFRERGTTSDNLNHCPLGLQSYQNNGFDGPQTTLPLQNGAESIPAAYPSGIGLVVSITGVSSDGHIVLLGVYINGDIGEEPGMLASTGLQSAENDNGDFILFVATIGVNCTSGFTGPQCITPLTGTPASTQSPTETPTTTMMETPRPSTATTEAPPTTATTTASSSPVTPITVTATTGTVQVPPTTVTDAIVTETPPTVAPPTTATTENPPTASTTQSLTTTKESEDTTITINPTAFSLGVFTLNVPTSKQSSTDAPAVRPLGLGVGFLIGFTIATVLALLVASAVHYVRRRAKKQVFVEEGDKIEMVERLEFETEK